MPPRDDPSTDWLRNDLPDRRAERDPRVNEVVFLAGLVAGSGLGVLVYARLWRLRGIGIR